MEATSSSSLAHINAWLAADGHGGNFFFFAAAGGLAHLKAWLATDGRGGDIFFLAAAGFGVDVEVKDDS
jgi:hypothetical protein